MKPLFFLSISVPSPDLFRLVPQAQIPRLSIKIYHVQLIP